LKVSDLLVLAELYRVPAEELHAAPEPPAPDGSR
jgi:hypothetical protein